MVYNNSTFLIKYYITYTAIQHCYKKKNTYNYFNLQEFL